MRERVQFPGGGEPNRHEDLVIGSATSQDGQVLRFLRTYDEKTGTITDVVSLQSTDPGGYKNVVSSSVLRDLGEGDLNAGIAVLSSALAEINLYLVVPGERDPLYDEFIFPHYGGEAAYIDKFSK